MRGNISLTTVLIFSALFITTAIVIIYQAIDFARSTTSYTNQVYAQNVALSCLEESLYKISSDTSFSSDFEIVLEENEQNEKVKYCSAIVGSQGNYNEIRTISVTSHYKDSSYTIDRTITDVNLPQNEWDIH